MSVHVLTSVSGTHIQVWPLNMFVWYARPSLEQVPKGPSLFIAQEFLDALPIHKFQYTAKGWREILVDMNVKVTETGAQGHGVVDAGTEVKDTRTGGGEVTGDGAGNSVEDFR